MFFSHTLYNEQDLYAVISSKRDWKETVHHWPLPARNMFMNLG